MIAEPAGVCDKSATWWCCPFAPLGTDKPVHVVMLKYGQSTGLGD